MNKGTAVTEASGETLLLSQPQNQLPPWERSPQRRTPLAPGAGGTAEAEGTQAPASGKLGSLPWV